MSTHVTSHVRHPPRAPARRCAALLPSATGSSWRSRSAVPDRYALGPHDGGGRARRDRRPALGASGRGPLSRGASRGAHPAAARRSAPRGPPPAPGRRSPVTPDRAPAGTGARLRRARPARGRAPSAAARRGRCPAGAGRRRGAGGWAPCDARPPRRRPARAGVVRRPVLKPGEELVLLVTDVLAQDLGQPATHGGAPAAGRQRELLEGRPELVDLLVLLLDLQRQRLTVGEHAACPARARTPRRRRAGRPGERSRGARPPPRRPGSCGRGA